MVSTTVQIGYAAVNGLYMYYEIHGSGRPLVLLHGAFMTIDGFGRLLPALAEEHQVIAVEQQGHGRTADIDRSLCYEQMADDTAALLRHLAFNEVDVVGYSLGGGVALQLALRHPGLVRKLVVLSATFNAGGFHPGILEGISTVRAEAFAGSPIEAAYLDVAPNPAGWRSLVEKVVDLDGRGQDWPPESIEAITAPTMVVLGDSDVIRPEHAVELFRLRGGGVAGDLAGLPSAQLAILPGTTHAGVIERVDWLGSMISAFLETP